MAIPPGCATNDILLNPDWASKYCLRLPCSAMPEKPTWVYVGSAFEGVKLMLNMPISLSKD